MQVAALDHLVLTVANLEQSVDFYQSVLGMEKVTFTGADGAERVALKFGSQKINLHPISAPLQPHAKAPTGGSADLCFLTEQSIPNWQKHLTHLGVEVEIGPVPRTGAEFLLLSLYIRDPDGNLIEIATQN
jgi:catechol 2,3-dioxygenase-like lactoylglutathione lyase family enzyme